MLRELVPLGVQVPDGFAVTAEAYRYFMREAALVVTDTLSGLDPANLPPRRVATTIRSTRRVSSSSVPTSRACATSSG
jgi:phosphoenolpyruvate synthase/pyruvate phosphate dikinase